MDVPYDRESCYRCRSILASPSETVRNVGKAIEVAVGVVLKQVSRRILGSSLEKKDTASILPSILSSLKTLSHLQCLVILRHRVYVPCGSCTKKRIR